MSLAFTQNRSASMLRGVDFVRKLNGAAIVGDPAIVVEGDVQVTEVAAEGTLVRYRIEGGTPGQKRLTVQASSDALEDLVEVVSVYITG